MPIELDDLGVRVVGNNVRAVGFYDDDRALRAEIYLDENNRLNITNAQVSTGAPGGSQAGVAAATYLVLSAHPDLSHERVFAPGSGLQATDGGAGATYALAVRLASPAGLEFSAGALRIKDSLAGAGLAITDKVLAVGQGDGLTVSADAVALTTPGTLSVSSTNAAAGNHTHAVTSTHNPGAAASLLATNGDGDLILDGGVLYVSGLTNNVWINAGTPDGTAALNVRAPGTSVAGLRVTKLSGQTANLLEIENDAGADYLIVTATGDLESGSPGFVSGLTGWQLGANGRLESANVVIRGEIRASTYVIGEKHAIGGELIVRPAGVLVSQAVLV